MKKICKIGLIFLIVLNLYALMFSVYADEDQKYHVGGDGSQGIWDIGNDFLDLGADGVDAWDMFKMRGAFSNIIDFLWGIGLLIVFISTIVLGIKYMLVNPNEKSRVKQATTPYIIGVVIIFGAVTIWKLIIQILEGSMGIGG